MNVVERILIWIIRNLDLVVFVLFALAGLATLPLMGMLARGLLPNMLAEPIASNLFKVILAGIGGGRLHQRVTDEYTIVPASGDEEPPGYWSRLAGQRFGLSYERCPDAFDGHAEELDPEAFEDDPTLPGSRMDWGISRGDKETFVDTTEDAGLFVRWGELLERLKDADGLDAVTEAQDQTLRDEGGDTGMETKWRVIFWLSMAGMGLLAGVGYFYIL